MLKNLHDGRTVHLNGWKRQRSDVRDNAYRLKHQPGIASAKLPTSCDLRSTCSPIDDQGDLGSCTANMLAGMIEQAEWYLNNVKLTAVTTVTVPTITVSNVTQATDGSISFTANVMPVNVVPVPAPTPAPIPPVPVHKFIDVSRLFQYYVTRQVEGTTSTDSGATIRDTLKAANKYGVLDEKLYPYDISKFTKKPATALYTEAAKHKVVSYHSIADGDLATMKSVLASGYLVGFGFSVYSSFLSQKMATEGVLHYPVNGETYEGGHAVCLCGYDDARGQFLVRNSWGINWGLKGYFWMDYEYVADTMMCNDFWVIQASPI